uniref:Phosphatidylinositol-glycan biosynthesis class X protein n=1 Tax=Panagrellus redivivus TaxID=6233 RepID=A0A7E4V4F7_PANRE
MTGVNEKYFNPNLYVDNDALHCPLGPDEYVVCPAKQAGKVCVCFHETNMTVYNGHLCLHRLTSFENVHRSKDRIIYLRIKHHNIISIEKELLPDLAKPMIELNVTDAERSVVHLQCMPNPDELVVAYSVSLHDVKRKFDDVAWQEVFGNTLSEGGKLEVVDAGIFLHYYEFRRFMKSVVEAENASAQQTMKPSHLAAGILFVVGLIIAAGYVFTWIYNTNGAFTC